MRRGGWWKWLVIGGVNAASIAGCQIIAGLDGPLSGGAADATADVDAGVDAGALTCSPSTSCGDPAAGCCITHDGSAFTSACVTAGCAQSNMNLYFCYSPADCPDGQLCCGDTLYSPPSPPNKIYATVCSAGACPTEYSTLLCDSFHASVCGDAACFPQDTPPASFPSYSYCNN